LAVIRPASPDSEVADPNEDEGIPARPLRLAEAVPGRAIRRKAEQSLQERGGLAPAAAKAIVRAVESPQDLVEQLEYPTTVGVHGGTLSYVTCRVRNAAVLPLPTNPRVSGIVLYPAGEDLPGSGIEALDERADRTDPHSW
jgi:hypothetical protein